MKFAYPSLVSIGLFFAQQNAQPPTIKNTAAAVISIAWIFVGYFALPVIIKSTLGFLGTLGGFVNDRSRGVGDRLKNFRKGKVDGNMHDLKTGNRLKNREFTNPITGNRVSPGRRFNTITRGVSTGPSGHFGVGQRGQQANHQAIETAANDVMKGPQFAAISQYDDALKAGTYNTENEARAAGVSEDGIQAWRAAGFKFGDRNAQYAAARQRVSTGTGYQDTEDANGNLIMSAQEDMEKTMARVSHGNLATIGALGGFANSETKKTGRPDLAPGAAKLINRIQQQAGVLPVGAKAVSAGEAQEEAWNSVSLYQHANSKPQNIKAAIRHYSTEMQSGDREKMKKAAVFFEELRAVQPNASGSVSNEINKVIKTYDDKSGSDGKGITDLAKAREFLMNPAAGTTTNVTTRREIIDHQKVQDPTTGDITIRPRTITVDSVQASTERDRVQQEVNAAARTYQRPDPNNMDH